MAKPRNTKPSVKKGGTKMPTLNPKALERQQLLRKKGRSVPKLLEGIRAGNRVVLSQAITLVESSRPDHQEKAQQLLEACLPFSGDAVRIGITGTPGVGKSTFIEAFGQHLSERKRKIAVLAVDPSSQLSKGSILGDKTRMAQLSVDPNTFIRPSAAGESLGGVARKTRESMILCEAAGFDVVLVETVGVGQSEIAVHSMVDFFLLLLLPGSGDELQGIKRGIVEMADLVAVNKSDGQNLEKAKQSKRAYRNALHLYPPKGNEWIPQVQLVSALERKGLKEIYETILNYERVTKTNDSWKSKRKSQNAYWFHEALKGQLFESMNQHPVIKSRLEAVKKKVIEGEMSAWKAANELVEKLINR
ncbi:MAG: methylmalonyl Co-A mutase-associated GTPase MeaB [Bacteroidota bacterium]